MIAAFTLTAIGCLINSGLVIRWLQGGLRLKQISHPGLLGLLLIIFGFQTFVFTLLFHMINNNHERPSSSIPPKDL